MRISLLFALLLLAGCTGYVPDFGTTVPNPDAPTGAAVVCTQEIKVCPDGSQVGRVPPSCAFAQCPQTSAPVAVVRDTTPSTPLTCDYNRAGYQYVFRTQLECSGKVIECPGGVPFSDPCGCGCIITAPSAGTVPVADRNTVPATTY